MTNYYANSAVPGPGAGTIGDPWDDITTHMAALVAGDTMYAQGSFADAQINFGNDGTALNPIVLTVWPGQSLVITGQAGGHGIDTSGYDYCHIIDLEIDKGGDRDYGIKLDGDNNLVQNCEIHECKYGGVTITGDDNVVEDCTIYDMHNTNVTDAHGVFINEGFGNIIQRCEIYDCHGDGVQMRNTNLKGGTQILDNEIYCTTPAEALCCEGAVDIKRADASDQSIIRGNTFHGYRRPNNTCGSSGGLGYTIAIHQDADNVLVEDNIIYDCSHGIRVSSAPSVVVQNNLLYEFVVDYLGDSTCVLVTNTSSDPHFYNNTFVDMPDAMWDMDALTSATLRNNLHQDTGSCTGGASADIDYSGWYDVAGSYVGANDTTGTAPQPQFTDAGNDDYTLLAASTAIDAGTNVGIPYTGSAPDLGAFEYLAPGTTVIMVIVVVVVMTP